MASRRKLEVEEAQTEETSEAKISFAEACVIVTTLALVLGIVFILYKLGSTYNAGPFGG